jgi:hypothetical protein
VSGPEPGDRRREFRRADDLERMRDHDLLIELRSELRGLEERFERHVPDVSRLIGDVRSEHAQRLTKTETNVLELKTFQAQQQGALWLGRWAVATTIASAAATAAIVTLLLSVVRHTP